MGHRLGRWRLLPPGETAVDRDILALPEIMLDSLDLVSLELAQQLHSIFAIVWNASGRPDSTNYNTAGVWAAPVGDDLAVNANLRL